MIVVSDTTPINYLVLIGEIDILPALYGKVIIPSAVFRELQATKAPPEVKEWLNSSPEWLEVKSITQPADISLIILDAGEREAIQLAEELKPTQIIIDEKAGRQIAEERGLQIVGTLGVLADASISGLIDISQALQKLQQTTFRISPELIQVVLDRVAEREQERQQTTELPSQTEQKKNIERSR